MESHIAIALCFVLLYVGKAWVAGIKERLCVRHKRPDKFFARGSTSLVSVSVDSSVKS